MDASYGLVSAVQQEAPAVPSDNTTAEKGQALYDAVCTEAAAQWQRYLDRRQKAQAQQKEAVPFPIDHVNVGLLLEGHGVCPGLWAAALLARLDACQEHVKRACDEPLPTDQTAAADDDSSNVSPPADASSTSLPSFRIALQTLLLTELPDRLTGCKMLAGSSRPVLPVLRPIGGPNFTSIASRIVGSVSLEQRFTPVRIAPKNERDGTPTLQATYRTGTEERKATFIAGVQTVETGDVAQIVERLWNYLAGAFQLPVPDFQSTESRAYADAQAVAETMRMDPAIVRRVFSSGQSVKSFFETYGATRYDYTNWLIKQYKRDGV